jgi:hypothetical protein
MSAGKFSSSHKPADQYSTIISDLVSGNDGMSTFSLGMSFHVDHRGQPVYPHRDILNSPGEKLLNRHGFHEKGLLCFPDS